MLTQHTDTYGLSLSPILAHFQKVPINLSQQNRITAIKTRIHDQSAENMIFIELGGNEIHRRVAQTPVCIDWRQTNTIDHGIVGLDRGQALCRKKTCFSC